MKTTIIKSSITRKIMLAILYIFAFCFYGIYGLYVCYGLGGSYIFWGLLSVLFFGFCMIIIFATVIFCPSILIISEKGFINNSNLVSSGFISWNAVKKISVSSWPLMKVISVETNNNYNPSQNKYQKFMSKLNQIMGYPGIQITLISAKEKPKDIVKLMNKYLDNFKAKEKVINDQIIGKFLVSIAYYLFLKYKKSIIKSLIKERRKKDAKK